MRFARSSRASASKATAPPLWPFVLASLCLHAVLLLGWKSNPQTPVPAGATLSVSLAFLEPAPAATAAPDATKAHATATPAVKRERRRSTTRATPAPSGAAREPAAAKPKAAPPPERLTKKTDPAEPAPARFGVAEGRAPRGATVPAGPGDAAAQTRQTARHARVPQALARTRVRELLLADLAHHFEYPWLARRRGWQGMVWLSVTVQPNGALDPIRVARSSGYEVLDRSALETMRRVGQLAAAHPWLGGTALELPLAIVYRLTD